MSAWRFPRYTLSARFNLATGTPYTRVLGEFDRVRYDPSSGGYARFSNLPDIVFLTGPRNGERLPVTQRLDISLTRSFFPRGLTVSPYVSVMNLYDQHNIFGYAYDYTAAPPKRIKLPQLPMFPTFGLSMSW